MQRSPDNGPVRQGLACRRAVGSDPQRCIRAWVSQHRQGDLFRVVRCTSKYLGNHMKARLGLVVPGLALGGGVPAVARFVSDVALRDGRANLRLVSLSMNSRDPEGLRLASPRSWFGGARQSQGTWNELPYTHVGA